MRKKRKAGHTGHDAPKTCMILNRQDCFRAASRGRCERAGGQGSGAFLRAGRKGNDADGAINGVLSRMVRIWNAKREMQTHTEKELRAALTGALSLCYTGIGGRRVAAEVAHATVSDVTSGVK